jgi:hypothetical protein
MVLRFRFFNENVGFACRGISVKYSLLSWQLFSLRPLCCFGFCVFVAFVFLLLYGQVGACFPKSIALIIRLYVGFMLGYVGLCLLGYVVLLVAVSESSLKSFPVIVRDCPPSCFVSAFVASLF